MTQVQGKKPQDSDGAQVDATVVASAEAEDEQAKLADDVDSLLDEIDNVLEENAEEFVRSYVQKGGQ